MKINIELAMLVRETKLVTVEVPDDFEGWDEDAKRDMMRAVYDADDGEGFSSDVEWGCEEATHYLLDTPPNENTPAQYIVDPEGSVSKVE